jgi:hypothetical protein
MYIIFKTKNEINTFINPNFFGLFYFQQQQNHKIVIINIQQHLKFQSLVDPIKYLSK